MSLLPGSAIESGGYDINNSLRFRSSASAFLNRTVASTGNRTTYTFSAWVKRGALTTATPQYLFHAENYNTGGTSGDTEIYFGDTDKININLAGTSVNYNLITTAVYRDPSAWYHIVVAFDTTQATAANRIKLYINGNQVTAFDTANYPPQNTTTLMNVSGSAPSIGAFNLNGTRQRFFDGYMADINFIDGQALTPSSFGQTDPVTGVWQPKAYTGTYGTNGFYLKFDDASAATAAAIGKDSSGNGNNWTPNNISVTSGTTYDAMTDSPTNTSVTVANYAVFDVTIPHRNFPVDGNLKWTGSASNPGSAPWGLGCQVNFPMSSGKWYWEVTKLGGTSNLIGILDTAVAYTGNGSEGGADGTVYSYYYLTGGGSWFSTTFNPSFAASYATNDVIGVAFDADNNKLYFAKNGTWQASGDPSAGTNGVSVVNQSGSWVPMMSSGSYTSNSYAFNGGQRPFAYTPPTGFNRLNTYNLPDSTIKKGNSYMDATLWTGTGSSLAITNAGSFRPDLVWGKRRNGVADNILIDSVVGGNPPERYLSSNSTSGTFANADVITSLNSNGFTVGTSGALNGSSSTYVGWQWQAGSSTVTNTSGSTTSQVRANTTTGFSIVTYTGTGSAATIGHGLGVAPKMIITKGRNTTIEWLVYHASLGATNYITLNTSGAAASAASAWNNTAPTSTVFSVLSAGSTNFSGTNYVAYCFAEIAGFSRFGSYTGNGSADGTFVYLGFRPKFIIFKQSSGAGEQWIVFDSVRTTSNIMGQYLHPSLSNQEETFSSNDFLSNGFKIRVNHPALNTNGATYIYMAFAENPFKNSLAR